MFQHDKFLGLIGESVIILVHKNADPDSIGAAKGIQDLISILKPTTTSRILVPDDISSLSEQIAFTLNISYEEDGEERIADTFVLVDVGSMNQVGSWAETLLETESNIIVIDHHIFDNTFENISSLYIHDSEISSASEMVYKLFKESGNTPSYHTAMALLVGIGFDTRHFGLGNSKMFQTVSELLDLTGKVEEVKKLLTVPLSLSDRIARLKAAQRLELHKIGGWIIATSTVGSFQSSAARAIIGIGADCAIVAGQDDDGMRVSVRSKYNFYQQTQVNLGEIMIAASDQFEGSGSGHPTAAGFNGSGSEEEFLELILELIRNEIE